MLFTFLFFTISVKPFKIASSLAPPPTSKKFAGLAFVSFEFLISSIVAIARPAPFTIQPISPSKAIYANL